MHKIHVHGVYLTVRQILHYTRAPIAAVLTYVIVVAAGKMNSLQFLLAKEVRYASTATNKVLRMTATK